MNHVCNLLFSHRKFVFLLGWALCVALLGSATLAGQTRQTILHVRIVASRPGSLEIFYDTGAGFRDEGHQVCTVLGTGSRELIRYFVPDKPVQRVKMVASAGMAIESIELVNQHNAHIAWIEGEKKLSAIIADMVGLQKKRNAARQKIFLVGHNPLIIQGPLPNIYGFHPFFFISLVCVGFVLLCLLCLPLVLFLKTICCRRKIQTVHIRELGESVPKYVTGLFIVGLGLCFGAFILWHVERPVTMEVAGEDVKLVRYRKNIYCEIITLVRWDGLRLHGRLFRPALKQENLSAVLLFHGNYPQGGGHPLYRVLASELASRGYLVLVLDTAGFGGSGDPWIAPFRWQDSMFHDAITGINYLRQQPGVRSDRIHVIGHSQGADSAIILCRKTDYVCSLALIGPPRRVYQRYTYQPDVDLFWQWHCRLRNLLFHKKDFPAWYGKEVWLAQIFQRDMVRSLPYFSQWDHEPVLFIDGEREIGADKEFLQWFYQQTSQPKKILTVPGAGHENNVLARDNGIYYDPVVMSILVSELDHWFAQAEKPSSFPVNLLLNVLRKMLAFPLINELV